MPCMETEKPIVQELCIDYMGPAEVDLHSTKPSGQLWYIIHLLYG
jgi:hypothetical protein